MANSKQRQTKGKSSSTPYTRPKNCKELAQFHTDITRMARQLMITKNHDYGADDDPFRNFHTWGAFGILVRLDDKLSRLRTFAQKGRLDVTEETVLDTSQDLINYAVLLAAYLGKPQKE